MNPSNGASGKIHKFVSKKHNQKINYKKNICNMKHVKNFFGSIVILLSMLFVGCNNNISNHDIESNKQKSRPQYTTNNNQTIDSYIVEVILPLYDKMFDENGNIDLNEVVEKYNYYIDNFNVFEAIRKSDYYKSYSKLPHEKLIELYNNDYPYFVYHAIKAEGSPKIRELLNTIDTNATGFSTLDSIIYSSKHVFGKDTFFELIKDKELLPNELLFVTSLYVINYRVPLLKKFICYVRHSFALKSCIDVYILRKESIEANYLITGDKSNYVKQSKENHDMLDDCYKDAERAYESCLSEEE